jgi:hypothetical protein
VYAGGDDGGAPGRRFPASSNAPFAYDNAVAHGLMMFIINALRAGDYLKVAFVALAAGLR